MSENIKQIEDSLNQIQSDLKIIQEKGINDKQRELLNEAVEVARKFKNIADDLKKDNKIEAEKRRLAPMVFEDAPKWVKYAAMNDVTHTWYLFEYEPELDIPNSPEWVVLDFEGGLEKLGCNHPRTYLHWTDTLLKRSNYE